MTSGTRRVHFACDMQVIDKSDVREGGIEGKAVINDFKIRYSFSKKVE